MKLLQFVVPLLACTLGHPLAQANDLASSSGRVLFRSNCAFCHGLNAKGGRGPSLLSGRVAHELTDTALKEIIRHGIAGTSMPAFEMEEPEAALIVSYIRGLTSNGGVEAAVHGDARAGKQVYDASGCASCHRIGDEGSVYGPDLTRVGGARSVDYLHESIVKPSVDIQPEYEGVTVITRAGQRVTGVRINEDTFTVQLRQQNEKFAMFKKDEVKSVTSMTGSLMPPYDKLPANDLEDLIAYLLTLRGDVTTSDVNKVQGIH